jgi:DNA-binding response OmpR family regulator
MTMPLYHILVVDDSKRDALLLERTLQQAEDAVFSVTCVETAQAGLDAFDTHTYDLVLLDYYLPDMDGLAFLEQKRRRGVATPVIMLTAFGRGPGLPVAALQAGAMDYFSKYEATSNLFSKAIKQVIERARLEVQVEQDTARLRELEATVERLQEQRHPQREA